MFYVARLTEEGQWLGLRSTTDEDYAETLCDFFSDQMPYAYIDVLTYDEFHNQKGWDAMMIR